MLRIGDLAREGGVTVEAVRYYEREGLIKVPVRDVNGYRLFERDAVRQIRFIKRAQDVGFTLTDVRELLCLRIDPGASCFDVRDRARVKVSEIDQKITTLAEMRRVLASWIERCRDAGPVAECPILDALESDEVG